MPTAKLTKSALDRITPGPAVAMFYDSHLKGFGLRVTPAGARSWFVEYRPHGGGRHVSPRRHTIGPVAALTPDMARNAARDLLAAVRLGDDPAARRTRQRETPTFAAFAAEFLAGEAKAKLKPRTIVNYEIYLRRHAGPVIGGLKIDKVTEADVARLHRSIGNTRPLTANRVVEFISSVFRVAGVEGVVPSGFNPTRGIRAFREERRERFLTIEEMQRLGATLARAETEGLPWACDPTGPNAKHLPRNQNRIVTFTPHVTGAVRLLLLTGCRLREILHLRWTEVDWDRGLLLLPDSKTGRRAVVLGVPALAVLSTLPRVGAFVIAGDKPDAPRHDLKKPWKAITAHAGLVGLRLHDLRHSFASIGAGSGLGLPIVGKLLGHASPVTTARYAHLDNDPLKRAANAIGEVIAAAMGTGRPPGADCNSPS